jgi:hypothetical protein
MNFLDALLYFWFVVVIGAAGWITYDFGKHSAQERAFECVRNHHEWYEAEICIAGVGK